MMIIALLGAWLTDLNVLGSGEIVWWRDIALGLGIGLGTVLLSKVLDHYFEWARTLSRGFRSILGPGTWRDALVLATLSGIGEELLFRGFLQQWFAVHLGVVPAILLASLIFGAVHVGPDWKKFWPWTVMALVMGVVLGLAFAYTSNVVAVVIAHFTINFINLTLIFSQDEP
jgi:membrane protease YdiL (CAAX protease family)